MAARIFDDLPTARLKHAVFEAGGTFVLLFGFGVTRSAKT